MVVVFKGLSLVKSSFIKLQKPQIYEILKKIELYETSGTIQGVLDGTNVSNLQGNRDLWGS